MTEAQRDVYARAGALFDAWVELPEDERAPAIAAARAADPPAAAMAEGLLRHDASPSPWSPPVGTRSDDPQDPAGVLGNTIGPYHIERLLGSGGMGAVYLAVREDPQERVAIKFLSLQRISAAALERFADEARLLAGLDHPGVVRYRDSGVDALARPYLVMDYVEGDALDPRQEPLASDVRACVALVEELAAAVQALHQRRVLHRDLKPSNVLVRREGDRLRPVLIDLGIARALHDDAGPARETGTLGLGPVGTPAFMSPEQSVGRALADVRTDVHGLGATCYALLTGRAPRELEAEDPGDPIEVHVLLRSTDPKPPSRAIDETAFQGRAAARRRAIDRNLDAIVLKALARAPEGRYGSAEALANDLARWRTGRPVDARAASRLERGAKFVRRNPLPVTLITLTVLALIATVAFTTRSRAREARAALRYRDQLARTERMNRFYIERVLSRALPELDGPTTPVAAVLERAAEDLSELDRDPRTSLAVRAAMIGIFGRLAEGGTVDRQLAEGRNLAAELDPDDPARLNFELEAAILAVRRHDYESAVPALRALLEHTSAAPERFALLDAQAANALAVALLSRNELEEVDALLARADQGLPADHRDQTGLRNTRAFLAIQGGRNAEAVAILRDLERWLTEHYGAEHAELQAVHVNLAKAHLGLRDPESAMRHAEEAIARGERVLPEGHPDRIIARSLYGSALSQSGRFEEAVDVFLEVVAAQMEAFGPENEAVGVGLANLASVLISAGRPEEASSPAAEGHAILERVLGPEHPDTISALSTTAFVHLAQGDVAQARRTAQRVLELYRALPGDFARDVEEIRAFLKRLE